MLVAYFIVQTFIRGRYNAKYCVFSSNINISELYETYKENWTC